MVDDGAITAAIFAAAGFALIIIGMQELAARIVARGEYQGRIEKNFSYYLTIFVIWLLALHSTLMIIAMIVLVAMGETDSGLIIGVLVYAVITYAVYYKQVKSNEILRNIEDIEDITGITNYIEEVKTKLPRLIMVGDVWHWETRGGPKHRRRVRVDDHHAEEQLVYQRCQDITEGWDPNVGQSSFFKQQFVKEVVQGDEYTQHWFPEVQKTFAQKHSQPGREWEYELRTHLDSYRECLLGVRDKSELPKALNRSYYLGICIPFGFWFYARWFDLISIDLPPFKIRKSVFMEPQAAQPQYPQ